jgi:hypothetical protein
MPIINCRVTLLLILLLFALPLLAGHEVSDVRYAPSDLAADAPAIASNGDRVLTLWAMPDHSYRVPSHVYGSFSGAFDSSSSTAFPVVPYAGTAGVAVVGTGSGYVAIWNERDTVPVFGRISSVGHLEQRVLLARVPFVKPRMAFNGSQIAIVESTGSQASTIDISIYDLDGNLLRRSAVTAYSGEDYAVTALGSDFVVVIAGATGINEWRIANDGAVHPAVRILPPPTDHTKKYGIAVAAKGGRIVTTWIESHSGEPKGILTSATIQPDGTITQSSLPAGSAPPVGEPAVVAVNRGYFIAWNVTPPSPAKPGVFALRLDESGKLIDDRAIFLGEGQFSGLASAGNTIKLACYTPPGFPWVAALSTMSAEFDANGITPYSEVPIASPVRQFAPAVTGNGAGFTAAWLEEQSEERHIVAGRITPAGVPLDGRGIILETHAESAPAIAHSPSGELIVWMANGRLKAVRLSVFGGVLDATPIDIAPAASGSCSRCSLSQLCGAVWNGSRFFVVWTDGNRFFDAFVGPDGVATPARDLTSSPYTAQSVSIAWDGQKYILVFDEIGPVACTCPAYTDIRVMRISAAGVAIDFKPVIPPFGQPSGHIHVASSGSESLIVIDHSFGLSSSVVREEGGRLHFDPEVPLLQWYVGSSSVAWDGSSYVVSVQHALSATSAQSEAGLMAAIQVSQSGIPLRTLTRLAAGPPDFFLDPPSIATDIAGGTAFLFSEVAPPTYVARARLYSLSEFSPGAGSPPPPAPRNVISYFSGTTARIDWESDGGATGFLINRLGSLGTSVPADARTVTVNATIGDLLVLRASGPGGLSEETITSIGSMPRRRAARH